MKLPLHTYDLIDELDRLKPEVIYDPDQNMESFLLRQGERRLIHWLKALRQLEQQDALEARHV